MRSSTRQHLGVLRGLVEKMEVEGAAGVVLSQVEMMFVLRRLGVAPTSFRGLPPAKLVVLLRAALHGTPMNMPVGLLHRLGSSASISMRDQQTFLQLRQKLKVLAWLCLALATSPQEATMDRPSAVGPDVLDGMPPARLEAMLVQLRVRQRALPDMTTQSRGRHSSFATPCWR